MRDVSVNVFFSLANSTEAKQSEERREEKDREPVVERIISFHLSRAQAETVHPLAHDVMREISKQSPDGDEQPEDTSAHRVRHGFHQRCFNDGITGEKEKAVNEERWHNPIHGHVWEHGDKSSRDNDKCRRPAQPRPIAEMAE